MAAKLQDIDKQIKTHQNNEADEDDDSNDDNTHDDDGGDSDSWESFTDEDNEGLENGGAEKDLQETFNNLAIDRPPPSTAFSEVEEAHSQHSIQK